MKALIIGGISIDTLIYTPEITHIAQDMSLFASKTTKQMGGTGLGKALIASKLFTKTTLVTQAAKEDYDEIKDFLISEAITPIILETDTTERHTNIMHGENNRLSIFTNVPKDGEDINKMISDEMLEEADIIFLNINSFCKPIIPRLYLYKEKVVVDIHDYQIGSKYHDVFLDVGAYLFTSCIYLNNQIDFLEDSLKQYNLKTSVITCNKAGAMGMDAEQGFFSETAIKDIKMVDSNGAGDAFLVGFMHHYLENAHFKDSLLFGNICGAFSCESKTLFDIDITKEAINNRFFLEKNRLQ